MTDELTPQGISLGGIGNLAGGIAGIKNYIIYGLLAVIAGLGIWIIVQRAEVATANLAVQKQKTEITTLKIERDVAKANEERTKKAFDEQSKNITDEGKKYKDAQDKVDALNKWIRDNIANGHIFKDADDVRNQNTPKDCKEALDFLNRNTK